MTSRSKRHARARRRGQALLEFALALPIILLLLFGIFDLGRAVFAFTTITEAARIGGRIAIVDQNDALIQSSAADYAVALNIDPNTVIVQYLTSDLAGPCASPTEIDCIASVTVPYAWTPATPVLSDLVGTIAMQSTTQLPIERSYTSPTPTATP